MSRQILPNELAEVVTALLVQPKILGQFDSPDRHMEFMEAIGEVVANFCGGQINGVHPADGSFDGNPFLDAPMLSVWPDSRLPDLQHCVWGPYDPDGWEEVTPEQCGIEPNATPLPLTPEQTRKTVQALLAEAYRVQSEDGSS